MSDIICPKCLGKGFTEQDHGLLMIPCDCEKGQEWKREITGETSDDSTSGARPDNQAAGSGDTGEPAKPKKPKAKRKARKKSR